MMKLRLALIFGMLIAVSMYHNCAAEEAQSEPEPESEAEPGSDHDHDHDHDHAASGKSEKSKAGENNPASAPWAMGVPAIVTVAVVAKYVL